MLSGDSLFVGDVARPDLAVEPEQGARELYRSLHERLLNLPTSVEVWPGHLGGSLCGSSGIDHRTSSTIGFELAHNHVVGFATADAFVADAIATLGDRPPNVEHVVDLNRGPLVEELGTPAPLSPRAVEVAIAGGAVLVDARTNDQFDEAHIPGAISASAYDTGFATKVAKVVPPDVELIVVAASDGYELAAADLLASVGLRVRGFLVGGMTAWRSEGRRSAASSRSTPTSSPSGSRPTPSSWCSTFATPPSSPPATSRARSTSPTARSATALGELPAERPIATVCSGGKRSGLAASLLQREGFERVIHVGKGGVGTWKRAGRPVESAVETAPTA